MLRICAFFVLIALPSLAHSDPSGPIRVIDGDTWHVGDTRVRLFGIDAPERDQTCRDQTGAPWRCGDWVTRDVTRLYQGRHATCEAITMDRFNRVVARCFVAGEDVGRILVQNGLAWAFQRSAVAYDLDEKQAFVARRGVHNGTSERPSALRARQAQSTADAPTDCAIKGNISRSSERIFHVPGQMFYAPTRISPNKGERWFCTEAEALNAGWRKAKN